jgi:hypothetical protein
VHGGDTLQSIARGLWGDAALITAADNVASQGINMVMGQQKQFSWTRLAVSAISAPIAQAVGGELTGEGGVFAKSDPAVQSLVKSTTSALVSAVTHLAIQGGKLQWEAIAADALSSTIREMYAPQRNEFGRTTAQQADFDEALRDKANVDTLNWSPADTVANQAAQARYAPSESGNSTATDWELPDRVGEKYARRIDQLRLPARAATENYGNEGRRVPMPVAGKEVAAGADPFTAGFDGGGGYDGDAQGIVVNLPAALNALKTDAKAYWVEAGSGMARRGDVVGKIGWATAGAMYTLAEFFPASQVEIVGMVAGPLIGKGIGLGMQYLNTTWLGTEVATGVKYFSSKATDFFGSDVAGELGNGIKFGEIGGANSGTLTAKGFQVTEKGLTRIEAHLSRPELDGALMAPENQVMLARLRSGMTTEVDQNFFMHELKESSFMTQGLDYKAAHKATLQWQGIPYKRGFEAKVYHPDAMKAAGLDTWSDEALKAAGLK